MSIRYSGKVGIGTSNSSGHILPQGMLDVRGSIVGEADDYTKLLIHSNQTYQMGYGTTSRDNIEVVDSMWFGNHLPSEIKTHKKNILELKKCNLFLHQKLCF